MSIEIGTSETASELEDDSWRPEPGEISRLAREILRRAVDQQASDVHINCQSDSLLVRYRVNGILHDVMRLSVPRGRRLVHHLKAIADMNIIDRRRPQDGRVVLELDGREVDCRLATIYALWGENLAIRIFDKSLPCRRIDELGMHPEGYQLFYDLIHSPQGLLLVTGPTGAGKTATLYAALAQIRRPEINIITVEDPIEHELERVNQIGVHPKIGLGFLECLRSAFRQDPDVMMIGEIRDAESARIAIRAALSGHLVLSTLHTGTAAEAVAALIHLGIEPFLISTSLVGVVAQQLVRKICPHCSCEVALDLPLEELHGPFGEELRRAQARQPERPLSFSFGQGCDVCLGSGYQDRTGIFEILRVSPLIRQKVLLKAPAEEIESTALREGLVSMRTLGVRLVVSGITTIEEVLRVVPMPEETEVLEAVPVDVGP